MTGGFDWNTHILRLKPNEQTSEPYYAQLKRKIVTLIESGKLHATVAC